MGNMVQQQDFIFYTTNSGDINIRAIVEDDTIWLTQKQLAMLFRVEANTITYHIQEIFNSNELEQSSTTRKIRVVQTEGSRNIHREILHYNLDMIIAVGYRVNSYRATQFRIWATKMLKEYLIKGFVLDDDRLKQGETLFGKDYFDELLERIQEIRASERRFYQKITDIYKECSADYDKNSPITKDFYAHAQNKLEYAIINMTSAEIIKERANHNLPNMGLTTWKKQKEKGKIYTYDVTVAKNYLNEDEISNLNRLVSQFLDFAEGFAKRGKVMYMQDWADKLNNFLKLNEYAVLQNYGSVSKSIADNFAKKEYKKYKPAQDKLHKSDFDKVVEEINQTKKLPKHRKEVLSSFNQNLKKAINWKQE